MRLAVSCRPARKVRAEIAGQCVILNPRGPISTSRSPLGIVYFLEIKLQPLMAIDGHRILAGSISTISSFTSMYCGAEWDEEKSLGNVGA